MAVLASLWESCLHVIGIGRRLVAGQVARHAGGVGQVVVSVHVALGTLRGHVGPGQREAGLAVIECGISPRRRRVAGSAGGRDSCLGVIGIRRSLEILHVARNTIRGCAGKLAVHVALGTGDSHVGSGQRELRECIVVERRGLPGRGRVATLARLRESGLYMVRIRCLLEIGEMTSNARRGRSGEFPSDVASIAIQRNVGSGQRESGKFQVVELGVKPGVDAVALFASGGKAGGHVTWTRGRLILLGMAGIALRSQALKLSGGRAFMAGGAIQCCVGSHQGKAVLVLVDLLGGNLPALYAVALLATGAELPLVDIGMAIGALVTYIREYGFDVALGTGDSLMQPTQRVPGLIVVKFRRVSDRLPSLEGMAILTGDIEGAVRTTGVGVGLRLPCRKRGEGKKQAPDQHAEPDRRRQRKTAPNRIQTPQNRKTYKNRRMQRSSSYGCKTHAIRCPLG